MIKLFDGLNTHKSIRSIATMRNTLFLSMALFATTFVLGGCSKDDPTAEGAEPVSYTVNANVSEIEKILPMVNNILDGNTKVVTSFVINGDFYIGASDFLTLRKLGALQSRLGAKFIFNGKIYPNERIVLRFSEWESWGKLALGAGFFVSESEKSKFGNQPVAIDDTWNGLERIGSIDYGTDGAVLKKYLPDTIVHSVPGADAMGLMHLKEYVGQKIIIKTVNSSTGQQPHWSNMSNEAMDLFETPAAPEIPELNMNTVYSFNKNPILTEYIPLGGQARSKPMNVGTSVCDTLAGNQGLVKLEHSNRTAKETAGDFARPNIVSKGEVFIVPPQVNHYKNPSGILSGPGEPKIEKGTRTNMNFSGLQRYPFALHTQKWAISVGSNEWNNISLNINSSEYLLVLVDRFASLIMDGNESWAGKRKKVQSLSKDYFGISISEDDVKNIEFVTMKDILNAGKDVNVR